MENKILVCGGAGYIGSHCVKMLIEEGFNVVVIDNLSTGHINAINEKAQFYYGDIRDRNLLNRIFIEEKIIAVIHFCAKSIVSESMDQPLTYFDNNVNGTVCLLEAMIQNNVKQIVFSSSAAVYGEQIVMPIDETYDPKPTNPYGETKLMMEKIMKWTSLSSGLKYVSLRYFNVAGADLNGCIGEDHRPETHLIPLVLQAALGKRDSINIYGDDYDTKDGTCVRDYIHVVDLINAHILALKYLLAGNPSEVFNLGSENGYSVLEILETVKRVTNTNFETKICPRRLGDPAKLIASKTKVEQVLGWKPKHGIEDIIKSAYDFHKAHLDGYKICP